MTGFYKEYDDTSGAYVSSAEDAAAAALVSKNAAAASATAAAASEVSAGNQATAASASETNAGTSATNAATSATNAATSETNAGNSATAAAGSATSASTDAGTATTKASEASTSATNAATSETNAASSATNAATSETNAATSATNAASSATTASTQATNAASSATAAATSETNAGNSATAAATSETNAASSATSASGSATTATTKAGEASTSATNAATSETNAATSATNSANSATSAGTAQTAAEAARDAALAAFDSFDDRYLGPKASDPTVDNDGDALAAGMLYFNTTTDDMKVYEGSVWVNAYGNLSDALAKANNLSDLPNVATARTNLGLGTAATTASTDYATAAQADQTVALTGAGATSISGTYPNFTITSTDNNTTYSVGDGGLTEINFTSADNTKLDAIEAGATADQTAAEILTAIKTVDGSGSGLDADTVDGVHEATFMRRSANSQLDMNNNDIVGVDQIFHEGDTNTYIQFHAADQWRVVTGGVERLEVNNSQVFVPGNCTINGTLSVRTAIDLADSDILRFGSGDDVEFFCNGSHMYMDLNAGIGNFYIRDTTTTRFTFDDAGHFTATGNITAYSDIRLKEDIKPIEDAVSKVQQLTGNTYTRNDLKDADRRYGGVIAQEVEVVLPEAVNDSEDGTKTVDYNALIALLVESIKELKAEVEELKGNA